MKETEFDYLLSRMKFDRIKIGGLKTFEGLKNELRSLTRLTSVSLHFGKLRS